MVQSMLARHLHLVGPAHAALPAELDEMIGDGAEHIRHRGPDVALAVAVEVDRVFVEARGQKLRLAHRAGPGRAHVRERDVALFEHLQREQKLLAELLLAAPEICLRRERAHRAVRHLRGAVIRLARPDRQHDRRPARRSAARSAPASRDAFRRARGPARRAGRTRTPSNTRRASARIPPARAGGPAGRGSRDRASVRSGSRPRVAVSKVARETPSFCASGHSDWTNRSNAASAKAAVD